MNYNDLIKMDDDALDAICVKYTELWQSGDESAYEIASDAYNILEDRKSSNYYGYYED
jgi:hypothetical protein